MEGKQMEKKKKILKIYMKLIKILYKKLKIMNQLKGV